MKKKLKEFAPWLALIVLIFLVFRNWFSFSLIASGDAPFYFQTNLKEFSFVPFIWSPSGLGRLSNLLYDFLYFNFPLKMLAPLNLPWEIIEKVVWYWTFIIISLFSSWYFFKTILPKAKLSFLSPFVYCFNSYVLMIIGGGQISIALAYAIFPLTIAFFVKSINQRNLKTQIITGLTLSLLMVFEPRIAALALLAAAIYALMEFRLAILRYLEVFLIPLIIVIGVHLYWLLPFLFLRREAYAVGLSAPGWVEFLSFTDFSDSFSLLHPNWPENIFGKTYFMRPEFLILPILAFSSLLFINQLKSSQVKGLKNSLIKNKTIVFFACLALIGAFLAKGSKPPFGGVYLWLFNNLPGMNMFRDPTKFYILVALSYSVLIPFSVEQISTRVSSIKYKVSGIKILNTCFLILASFLVYWLLLIKPAILGQLGGTFKTKQVPGEYLALKEFIADQEEFFRTSWIPKKQRFGFSSNNHPAIESSELLSEEELSVMGVKYIIIPFDFEGEIFLKDRKYDHRQRLALEEELDEIPWLKKIGVTDKIAIYETPEHKDHFFALEREIGPIDWTMVNPTKYVIHISKVSQPFNLVFSETYDELWQARIGEKIIQAKEFNSLNSFSIDQTGDLEIVVEFAAQKYVYLGGIISLATFLLVSGYLVSHFRQIKS